MSGLLSMFLCYLFVRCSGAGRGVDLSREELTELDKQLELLNKPAVKTIKTVYGEIYDCVDFYKQPAFDHPLLRNHSYHFQMKPKYLVEDKSQYVVENKNHSSPNKTTLIRLPEGGCPVGTVPIKRISKEDLIRQRTASESELGWTIVDVARTKDFYVNYTGASAYFTPYNPVVKNDQYSAARIELVNLDEYIQFGWRVDPTLYGDYHTHIFIKTNAFSAQCFDAQCGFVVSTSNLTPGFIVPPENLCILGQPHETLLRVLKDTDGNWWLTIGEDREKIGFWPSKLFTRLNNYATYAAWGGEVFSPYSVPGPEMGSGSRPTKDQNYDAYMGYITAWDISGNGMNPNTEGYTDESHSDSYYAIDDPDGNGLLGHVVFFGGSERQKNKMY